MRELERELSRFATAIVDCGELSPSINAGANYSANVAIEVYRNNYRGNLHDALAGAYPVLRQLVGDDFFRMLAYRFIERHPSKSGNLHHYGSELADFAAEFEPARALAYLPDIIRLEWACQSAYFACDSECLDLARLEAVDPERYPELVLKLHGACSLLRSKHPIVAIWNSHQPEIPGDFNIDLERRSNALVSRQQNRVRVDELDDDQASWLEMIISGRPLGLATSQTLAAHPEFDLQRALGDLLRRGLLIDFTCSE